ncbi:ABC transporter amino acid-binding protein [Bradyrhizobium diazoefficiens]|uniref:ABC transporter amino acid-binding protein n=1 Tax=Bradyrhizobium diazoefficiens TaxID=1355477 RepID=A0A0E3VVI4_9BRAD|nr:ABC transporter amino acid-binding protein [Bradyrhizobium diazoefficiens]
MALKRFVQAAVAALAIAAVVPASAQQVLKVGSTPTGIPFTFLDTKTNTIQGIMVDLITEIGKDAGLNVQIEPMSFSALIPSLTRARSTSSRPQCSSLRRARRSSTSPTRSTLMAKAWWCRRTTPRPTPRRTI